MKKARRGFTPISIRILQIRKIRRKSTKKKYSLSPNSSFLFLSLIGRSPWEPEYHYK